MIFTLTLVLCMSLALLLQLRIDRARAEKTRRTIRELEERLKDAEERYQILSNNLAAAIIIRDSIGRINFCNPYTEVLTGYPRSEILNPDSDFLLSFIHEEDRDIYSRALKVTAYGEAFQYRYRFYHKSGLEMWAETRTVPILDEHGVVTSSLSVLIDVTGTARYQRQVEEMNRDLQDFSFMVTHDLKAPISTIKGMINIITEEHAAPRGSESDQALKHIVDATVRLEQLVGSVLEYSKISASQAENEKVALDDILSDIKTDFSHLFTAAGAELRIPTGLPHIQGERLRIYQIFSNLIGNALKYRDPSRSLEVEIVVKESANRRNIAVGVKDNGIGIPADKQSAVFRPFFRVHARHAEGSGIGLACVKKLVEKVGGEIKLESSVGEGCVFWLKFVRAESSAVEQRESVR